MIDGIEIEEHAELDEEMGIDYHTVRGNPGFNFGRNPLSGRSFLPGTSGAGAKFALSPTLRKSVDFINIRATPTPVSKSWVNLGKRGLGRHGCPLSQVDPFAAELSRIRSSLALAEVQREATSEHNKLQAIDAYRARVLLRLRALLARRCG